MRGNFSPRSWMRGCRAKAVGLSLSSELHVVAEVAVTRPSFLESDRAVPQRQLGWE